MTLKTPPTLRDAGVRLSGWWWKDFSRSRWERATWILGESLPGFLGAAAAAATKSLQLCPTLCNPTDRSPPGSTVPGILQARTLEWVAISFSNAWKWKVKLKSLSRVRPSATSWTAAFQALQSMGFSRQEYWSGVPLPSLASAMCGFKRSLWQPSWTRGNS